MLKSISTFGLFTQRSENLRSLENDLALRLNEASTGRKSDVAGDLGVEISILNELRSMQSENSVFLSSIDAFTRRSDFMVGALTSVNDAVNTLVAEVVLNAPQAGQSVSALDETANTMITQLVDALNTSADGRFLFSGIDIDAIPLRRPGEINPATGLSPNDVMAGILDGAAYAPPQPPAFTPAFTAAEAATAIARFNEVFDGTNAALPAPTADYSFENTLYDGAVGGPAVSARVSNGAPVEYGVTAEDAAFRQALQGAYMLSSVDLQAMAGTAAYEPYITAALDLLTNGLEDIRAVTAQLGGVQADVEDRKAALVSQNLIINAQVNAYEQVDPIETQSLVSEIEKQIEAAYAATVRGSRLRLTNFI